MEETIISILALIISICSFLYKRTKKVIENRNELTKETEIRIKTIESILKNYDLKAKK